MSGTSYLIVDELVGLALGGLISGRIASGPRWSRVLGPSSVIMGAMMLGVACLPHLPAGVRVPVAFVLVGLMGLAGGIFLIPVESFIQVRPAPERKGATLAAANFVVFTGILVSGLASNAINAHLSPSAGFGVIGATTVAVGLVVGWAYRTMEKAP
jgi:predicted MFS family arabinose efflux permease